MSEVLTLTVLLAVLAVGHLISQRVRAPVPVVLAILGACVSWLPWLPREPLDPDVILFLFLPPLLYADAFDASWTDFRRWLRPILMLAVGLVLFTTVLVGIVAHAVLPQMPWPVCFILGAIVSPTDTVAVQAIIERLHVPRRITAILGGESLVNDATGLLGVQIGVAVLLSGAFQARTVALQTVLAAGIARLDAYCSETSCPLSVHHWREAMADELATLGEQDEEQRRLAKTRVEVSNEVRREVASAGEEALLKLRDSGAINDKTYLDLQLELDRQNMEGMPVSGGNSGTIR
ncbi:MAG: cation:proton antiporter [Planctomycetota bacterium]